MVETLLPHLLLIAIVTVPWTAALLFFRSIGWLTGSAQIERMNIEAGIEPSRLYIINNLIGCIAFSSLIALKLISNFVPVSTWAALLK